MKKFIIALAVIGFAVCAQAQSYNFTNNCNYKISLEKLNTINMAPLADESGSWQGHGIISFTLPVQPTNMPVGITMRPIDVAFNANCKVYITAAEIAAKTGSNEVVKVNKVLRDKTRELGSKLKAELAQ